MSNVLISLAIVLALVAAVAGFGYCTIFYFVPTMIVLGITMLTIVFMGVLEVVKDVRR